MTDQSKSRNSDPFTAWWSEHGNRNGHDYELALKAWNAAIASRSERGTTFTAIGYYDAPSKMTLWEPGKEPPHGALVYRPAERTIP